MEEVQEQLATLASSSAPMRLHADSMSWSLVALSGLTSCLVSSVHVLLHLAKTLGSKEKEDEKEDEEDGRDLRCVPSQNEAG